MRPNLVLGGDAAAQGPAARKSESGEPLLFLKNLINAPSPSGYEEPAARVWMERTRRFATIRTDVHGNVIGIINPAARLKVMLAGHIDEIGYQVKSVDPSGFLYIWPIGGVDPGLVPGQRVMINNKVLGVVGHRPSYGQGATSYSWIAAFSNMWIDIGATSKAEALSLVNIGDPVVNAAGFEVLRGSRVIGRGFDDRVGSFAVSECLRLLSQKKPAVGVYGVATVQEELGLRGARTSTFGIDPAIGIAIDVTHSTDVPGRDAWLSGEVKLGAGPVIARGPNVNHRLFALILKTAKEEGIPHQVVAEPWPTGTDANVMQITRAGVATALISIPNRYMHSSVEMVDVEDLNNVARLVSAVISRLGEGVDLRPYGEPEAGVGEQRRE
ncbi:MAG: M42 family metallopeptidase [Candidatus Riflebacteria bacterium]|nr:M42 family metallopeptidase [Candidatus Riflebacteria bacterium]